MRAARRIIATAPIVIPAIAPPESVDDLVVDEEMEGFDGVTEATAGEADAVVWPDVLPLVMLELELELGMLVELELELELELEG
ncbi:hypothetical protein MMC08_008694 [Hypocenomyce scalaris]|nr:hypothetical protein [Hypocenomyce scalaris]